MSVLKFGSIAKYFSQPLFRGFTTACAFQVLTTQLTHVFGIDVKKSKTPQMFGLIRVDTNLNLKDIFFSKIKTQKTKTFKNYIGLASNIKTVNYAALIFSCVAIGFLILFRIQVNERFKKQLKNIPIPIELIVIVVGTCVTYFAKLDKIYKLKIVGISW